MLIFVTPFPIVFKVEIFVSFALMQIVKEPTHVHHNSSTSLIDLVFVSNPVLSNTCHVVPPSLMQITRASTHKHLGDRQLSITAKIILRADLFGAIARLTGRKQVT